MISTLHNHPQPDHPTEKLIFDLGSQIISSLKIVKTATYLQHNLKLPLGKPSKKNIT